MDKFWKAKWLKALRSGRYKQVKNKLFKKDDVAKKGGYCCLGVLAKVQGACFTFSEATRLYYPEINGKLSSDANHLERGLTAGLRRNQQHKLAQMNDGGKSFKEIADYIEKKIKGVAKKTKKKAAKKK